MSTRFQPSLGNELYSPAGLFSKPKRRRSLSKLFESKPKDELVSNNINLRYISGPDSWYGFEFDNKAVHFFGDTHRSKEYRCEDFGIGCSTYKEYIPTKNCMTLEGLIHNIILTSEYKKDFYVDVLLEYPYESKTGKIYRSTRPVSDTGFIIDVYNYNLERLNSGKQFTNTNIHLLNIRYEAKKEQDRIDYVDIDLFTNIYYLLLENFTTEEKNEFAKYIFKLLNQGKLDYHKAEDYIYFLADLYNLLSTDNVGNIAQASRLRIKFMNQIEEIIKFQRKFKADKNISNYLNMFKSLHKKKIYFRGENISQYIINFIEQIDKKLIDVINKIDINDPNFYSKLAYQFLLLGASKLDMAVLTKLFKKIDIEDPEINITFAGSAHIETFSRFFIEILGLTPISSPIKRSQQSKFRCLENKDFGDIFGKWLDRNVIIQSIADKSELIAGDKYILGPWVSSGNFSDVYLGTEINTGETVAIKVLKMPPSTPSMFENEIKCLNRILYICKQEDVLCIKDFYVNDGKYHIVTEYLHNYIPLDQFVFHHYDYDDEDVDEIMKKIDRALRALKNIGIQHGDLNPSNIMIKVEDNKIHPIEIKLIDFAFCDIDDTRYSQKERLNDIEILLKTRSKKVLKAIATVNKKSYVDASAKKAEKVLEGIETRKKKGYVDTSAKK